MMVHARPRYFVLLVVLALHLAVIVLLVMSSRARRILNASPAPIELLYLPPRPHAAQPVGTATTSPTPSRKIKSSPEPVTELTLAPTVAEPRESTEQPIDWATEARTVAAAMAAKPKVTGRHKREDEPGPTNSIFPEPPSHHAGDEFTMPSGERAVFVSDSCYQVASTKPSNASNNGMVNPTYCVGKSKKPRGDLFDQIPAYKKYHAN
jgi:hypothetical protein